MAKLHLGSVEGQCLRSGPRGVFQNPGSTGRAWGSHVFKTCGVVSPISMKSSMEQTSGVWESVAGGCGFHSQLGKIQPLFGSEAAYVT